MRYFVGTSGFSYKEWKGTFYPEKLAQKKMLSYYAERLSTVEINSTFYRMPKSSVLESWAAEVPEGFRFVLKASQRITHHKRLRDVEETADYLFSTAATLAEHLGPILVQLPPNFKKDLPRLEAFVDLIPPETQTAFEFRHESWFDEQVYSCLRKKSCVLCVADVDGAEAPELVSTASWGYVRLRGQSYSQDDLAGWIKKLARMGWEESYVFFKHEDAGTGPRLAKQFLELAGQ